MKKKLKLENLQVQSFVTNIPGSGQLAIKGGQVTVNVECELSLPTCSCMHSDACPSAVNYPVVCNPSFTCI